jgi:hypothetical protein
VNITPEQIVTRMVEYIPGPFIVSDPENIARMGGSHQDPSTLTAWLEDSIIPVHEIEKFKKHLREIGMR